MKIWGTVLLVLGLLFLIMFALAEFGGGHIGVIPFFVSAFLILMGWNLRKSGKGILQQKPVEHPCGGTLPETAQQAVAAPEFSTVEMPLTPEITAIIKRQSARAQRILMYVVGGFIIFFCGLGVIFGLTDNKRSEGFTFLAIFASIGVASAVLIYGISWLTMLKPVRHDLRGTTYLRTTGPVEVVWIASGAMLRLADRAFLIDRRYGGAELSKLGWGRVDYSPHGHVILGAWDRDEKSVYSLPGYDATQQIS
jgi:hypothetical protein